MGRGRPPKPTAEHRARGSYRHDRHGKRAVEAEAGEPIAPAALSADERRAWNEIVEQLKTVPGLLTKADAHALETAAGLVARLRLIRRHMKKRDFSPVVDGSHGPRMNPLLAAEKTTAAELRQYLVLFGMAPSPRGSMRTPDGGGDDPFGSMMGALAEVAKAARDGKLAPERLDEVAKKRRSKAGA